MSKIKKILGITLTVLLILSAVPVVSLAYDIYTSEDGYLFYYIEDGGAIISYYADSISGDYTISDTLGGYPVTSIGNVNANDATGFCGCSSLTSVTIPDSVTTIAGGAFAGCTSLTSITVDEGNNYYLSDEYGVLFNKDKTELIKFPEGSSLTSYSIPNSVTSIGSDAFYNCTSLTSITIPDGVTSIGNRAFYGCTSLESITVPDSVTSIGLIALDNTAYYNNDSNWEDGVLYIGNHLIAAQTSISGSYEIKDGTITIAGNAFEECESLTSITIPDSVTSIGDDAFYYCTSLESVTMSDSVTSIGAYAFSNTAYYNDDSNWEDGVLYIGNHLIDVDNDLSGSYEIKEGTITIADYAFFLCESLVSIDIPNSVTSIGSLAFTGCTSLANITIPDSVTSIGDIAFGYTLGGDDVRILIDDFTIYGYTGTAAEDYANEYGVTFISLGEYAEEEETAEISAAEEPVSEESSSQAVSGGESSGSLVCVLIAAIIGMLVIAAVVVVIVLVVIKNNRNKTPQPPKYNGTYN
ncbi:MAG: leucine-rich repeat domain-containing protein [Clostridiales bacterium]|nr:leucine-rich repeat domain-containing protein [Clostridiales bacterium]